MASKSHISKILMVSFSFLILSFLLLVGLVEFGYKNARRITANNKEQLIENTQNLAETLSDEFQNGYININNLASLLSRSLTSEEVDVSYLQTLLANSIFDFIEFADKDGMDHNVTGGVSDARDRLYYKEAMKGHSGMELINKSRATYETLFMFYSPVYYNNKIIGSLIRVYQAKHRLKKILKMKFYGENSLAYICSSDGRIVATSDVIDTTTEFFIQDLLGQNPNTHDEIESVLKTSRATMFVQNENEVGGYIMRIPYTNYYLAQYFPESANKTMKKGSLDIVYKLIIYMVILLFIFAIVIISFYAYQQRLVEAANNAKSIFLLNMSHDIRTPMNAILGFTDLATKNIDEKERVLEYHQKIKASGENLLALINDVLDMSRIESGNVTITPVPSNIFDMGKGITPMFDTLAAEKNIDFSINIDGITEPFINLDRLRMNQILINVVSNAIKYTNNGGKVTLSATQSPCNRTGYGKYVFIVQDNGIGMSKEFQKHLFETFSREQTASVAKREGTGLGLSIVKRLVDLMGGKISVKSEQGVGSTFIIEFELEITKDENKNLSEAEKHKKLENLKEKRILLVDDNDYNREIARANLEDEGVIIEEAINGADALEKVHMAGGFYFDCILMDIQMPVMNGYEATKAIRKLGTEFSNLPIIALSANAFKEDIELSKECGMSAHLSKPIRINELLETLNNFV